MPTSASVASLKRSNGVGRSLNFVPMAPASICSKPTTITALAKLEQVLPAPLRRRVNALAEAVQPTGLGAGARVSSEVLGELALACRDHERVRFTYTAASGEVTRRRVEPHALAPAVREIADNLAAVFRGRFEQHPVRRTREAEADLARGRQVRAARFDDLDALGVARGELGERDRHAGMAQVEARLGLRQETE